MVGALRVAIVGCGNIADNHREAYQAIEGVEVAAVCDVDAERARSYATAHGIEVSTSSVAALSEHDILIVSVCTPHPTHEAVVVEAAAAGIHVLCEKPISTTLAAARRMVDAADDAGVTLGVIFQRRWWTGMRRLRAAIDDGTLGTPTLADCQVLLHRDRTYYDSASWRGTWAADGGGVLMTQAIHNVDLLQHSLGEPVEVYAKTRTFVHGDAIEVEDSAALLITFASGAIATMTATVTAAPNLGSRLTVTGSTGATISVGEYPEGADAVADVWGVDGQEELGSVYASGLADTVPVAEVNARLAPLHALQVRDFVEAVLDGRDPAVTGRDALRSLVIVEAAYASNEQGRPIPLDIDGSKQPQQTEVTR